MKVNIDDEPTIAQQYGVQSIPMIGLFRNGRLERSSVGAKPRQQLEAELGMLVIPVSTRAATLLVLLAEAALQVFGELVERRGDGVRERRRPSP